LDKVKVDERYNAEIGIPRLHVETVTCLKVTADHAEHAGEIWATVCGPGSPWRPFSEIVARRHSRRRHSRSPCAS